MKAEIMKTVQRLLISVVVLVGGLACLGDTAMAKVSIITNDVELIPVVLLADEYLDRVANKNTLRSYKNDLSQFLNFISNQKGTKIDKILYCDLHSGIINSFKETRLEKESKATVARRLNFIKAFTAFISEKHWVYDKSKSIRSVAINTDKFKSLSDEQLAALKRETLKLSIRDKFLIHFLIHTGLRNDEARNVTLGQFSEDFKKLENIKGKGAKTRNIPITKKLRSMLNDYFEHRYKFPTLPSFPLFVSDRNSKLNNSESYKLSNKQIYRIVRDACLDAGIPKALAHTHTLRHTFARITLEELSKVMNVKDALLGVMKLLGHSDLKTTMKYLTTDDDVLFDVLQRMG